MVGDWWNVDSRYQGIQMSNRITQLALQPGLLNYVDNETPRYYFICGHASDYEVNEFAKLILQECIDICNKGKSTQTTSTGAAQKIKLHFGIE